MTRPEIFIGLREPKSQLATDIHSFIATNGGRNSLAKKLELEWKPKYIREKHYRISLQRWTKEEYDILQKMYAKYPVKEIMKIIPRTENAIRRQIFNLMEQGAIIRKFKHYTYKNDRKRNNRT